MYKCVIFDLDGTLLNTLDDLFGSVNYALGKFGFPLRTKEEVRSFIGNGVVKLMERSTPDGTDEKTNGECLDCFRKHYLSHMRDNTAPYEGIIELLQKLKKDKIKTAVVSNKLHSAVVGLCDEYFHGLIDEAIGVSVESERKPSPVNVFKAMEKLSANACESIYVGDSNVDVETAKNAHLPCIGVTWGFRDMECLENEGAEFICDTADEVYGIVVSSK